LSIEVHDKDKEFSYERKKEEFIYVQTSSVLSVERHFILFAGGEVGRFSIFLVSQQPSFFFSLFFWRDQIGKLLTGLIEQ
jgi:hypothetical protein